MFTPGGVSQLTQPGGVQPAGGEGWPAGGEVSQLGGSVSWGGGSASRGEDQSAGGGVSQQGSGGSAKIGQQNEYSLHIIMKVYIN